MKLKLLSIATLALALTACGGKKSNEQDADFNFAADLEEWAEESEEGDTEAEEQKEGVYYTRPLTTEIAGPLKDYVTIEDKEYEFIIEKKGFGEAYLVKPTYEVVEPKKFNEQIELRIEFFDEDGNPVVYKHEECGEVYEMTDFGSFSAGFLQVALANGKNCTRTSFYIQSDHIMDFTPEMFAKCKTFKVTSELQDYGQPFDYDDELYK